MFRAFRYFRTDASRIGLSLGLMVLSIGANLLKPWPLAFIVDYLLVGNPMPSWIATRSLGSSTSELLVGLAVVAFGLHMGQGALAAAQNFTSIQVGLRGLARVRLELFERLQRLSLRFYNSHSQGDIIYRATWDTFSFQTLFQQGFSTFLNAFLSLAIMVGVMARLNLRLMLLSVVIVPPLILTMLWFGKQMKKRSAASHQAESLLTSSVQQNIAAVQLTQSYVREREERNRFEVLVNSTRQRRVSQHGWELGYWFSVAALFGMGTALIVWQGSQEVLAGNLSTGQLLIFLAYLSQWYEPLNQLAHVGATVADASAGASRVLEIIDAPESIQDPAVPQVLKNPRGTIELKNVSFDYETGHPILQGISLRIEPGESVAIIGPSGVGKTTLLQLLPRFYDPTGGQILLDGIDLRELSLRDLRSTISLVLQEPILLPGTIAENIAYARPGASAMEIEKAARAAHIHDFILKLPQGYETLVGEGLARLSVGEKQRINLARAFLKDAPILLLDEPTSALDAESERCVIASLIELMRGRTTLMVAHRLSTIRRVSKIIVLENGKLTQVGSPEALMKQTGYFSRVTDPEP